MDGTTRTLCEYLRDWFSSGYHARDVPLQQLEDLYVKEEHRNQGVGKAFFGELAHIAQQKVNTLSTHAQANANVEQDCARMDWSVLKVSKLSFLHKR